MSLESGIATQWTKQIGKALFLSNKETCYQCLSAQLLPAPGTALRHRVKGWLSQPLNKYFKSHSYCYFDRKKGGKGVELIGIHSLEVVTEILYLLRSSCVWEPQRSLQTLLNHIWSHPWDLQAWSWSQHLSFHECAWTLAQSLIFKSICIFTDKKLVGRLIDFAWFTQQVVAAGTELSPDFWSGLHGWVDIRHLS